MASPASRNPVILTIDVGNTSLTFGGFQSGQCLSHWRLPTDPLIPTETLHHTIRTSLDLNHLAHPIHTIISSVVPRMTHVLVLALDGLCASIHVLTYQSDFGLVIDYETPETLGVDRLVNCFAAVELYQTDCLVIDMGTATTMDVVTKDRVFKGGIILAGLKTTADGLLSKTAQLFPTKLSAPPTVIGTTTKACLQSGIVYGAAAQIDGLIKRIGGEWGVQPKVIITGGYADIISELSAYIDHIEPMLTLIGLDKMARRVCGATSSLV